MQNENNSLYYCMRYPQQAYQACFHHMDILHFLPDFLSDYKEYVGNTHVWCMIQSFLSLSAYLQNSQAVPD